MNLRRPSIIFFLLSFFVIAQTAVLLHAEIHPFHHHSEICLDFQIVQHHTADLPSLPIQIVAFDFHFQAKLVYFVFQYIDSIESIHPPRAPPLSIF